MLDLAALHRTALLSDNAALASLGAAWAGLAPSSLARKCSALRQFYGFLSDKLPKEKYPAPIADPLTWMPHAVNSSAMSQVWLFDAKMGPLNDAMVQICFNKPELLRVRQCPIESGGCGWLFLDTSRSGNRRWCDMRTCGNRAKARAHYSRAGA